MGRGKENSYWILPGYLEGVEDAGAIPLILPLTPLASLLKKTKLRVNSCHHQAIRSLAPSLVEMARSTDDLIEAVYLPGKTFVWAVQWHPEMSLYADEGSRKIFEAFVGAVNPK